MAPVSTMVTTWGPALGASQVMLSMPSEIGVPVPTTSKEVAGTKCVDQHRGIQDPVSASRIVNDSCSGLPPLTSTLSI